MFRMSMLRNSPVICGDRQIGLLQSISFDDAQKAVRALIVAGGLKGKCIVPADDILAVTKAFILAESAEKYCRRNETPAFRFARNTAGTLIGKVTDYLIDDESLQVMALEIMRGYMPSERRGRIWAFSYCASNRRPDEAIVPISLSIEQPEVREEACICVSQQ